MMKEKIKIGIELDNVLRNKNKQLLKYYAKDVNDTIIPDDIDEKSNEAVNNVVKFDTLGEKNRFIYIDYPFELFGCATVMDDNLATKLNNWLEELGNVETVGFDVEVFGREEEALTTQSSYFFLSKTGCRVRGAFFPEKEEELYDRYDYVFTADANFANKIDENGKRVIFITQNNKERPESSWKEYKTMENALEDDKLINDFKK